MPILCRFFVSAAAFIGMILSAGSPGIIGMILSAGSPGMTGYDLSHLMPHVSLFVHHLQDRQEAAHRPLFLLLLLFLRLTQNISARTSCSSHTFQAIDTALFLAAVAVAALVLAPAAMGAVVELMVPSPQMCLPFKYFPLGIDDNLVLPFLTSLSCHLAWLAAGSPPIPVLRRFVLFG
jgi:hypothetical protein